MYAEKIKETELKTALEAAGKSEHDSEAIVAAAIEGTLAAAVEAVVSEAGIVNIALEEENAELLEEASAEAENAELLEKASAEVEIAVALEEVSEEAEIVVTPE